MCTYIRTSGSAALTYLAKKEYCNSISYKWKSGAVVDLPTQKTIPSVDAPFSFSFRFKHNSNLPRIPWFVSLTPFKRVDATSCNAIFIFILYVICYTFCILFLIFNFELHVFYSVYFVFFNFCLCII